MPLCHINKMLHFQVAAFRQGFDQVFPLSSLTSFTPEEVQVSCVQFMFFKLTHFDILIFQVEMKLQNYKIRFCKVLVVKSKCKYASFWRKFEILTVLKLLPAQNFHVKFFRSFFPANSARNGLGMIL